VRTTVESGVVEVGWVAVLGGQEDSGVAEGVTHAPEATGVWPAGGSGGVKEVSVIVTRW
jgi:hypothetical protein